ncbi:MAG: IBR domain-containing protein [Oscillospiraceae bacterium]|jgi:hypothetical protein|nr:IBR domain-containing protein [Oscillospiraceae bacterium]
MATYCPNPNCGRKLKLKDWKVNCPACGTNILYYKMEERLLADADKVELEHVGFQKRIDRAKAAVVGSKWAIARLVLLFLPLGVLFLPLVKMTINAPYIDKTETFDIIKLFGYIFDGLDFDVVFGLAGTAAFGAAFKWFLVALVGVIVVVVCILAGLVTCFLASSPKGFLRSVLFNGLGIAGAATGLLGVTRFGSAIAAVLPGAVQSQAGLGGYLVILAFALVLALNIVIKTRGGVPVKYKQCYVSGFPAEEVADALAAGKTLDELRAERAAVEAAETEAAEAAPVQG